MSWSEKLSIRMARKLVPENSPYTIGQISHGIEIFLLYLLTVFSICLFSWLLGCFTEAVTLSLLYFFYRNFTGGVHMKSPMSCFIAGNVLVLALSVIAARFADQMGFTTGIVIVIGLTAFSFAVNWKYAPAKHTYVEIEEHIRKKNKKIVLFFLILGCTLSLILVYFGYINLAASYSLAVLLQAVLLHPVSYHLVKRFEQNFYEKGLKGNV